MPRYLTAQRIARAIERLGQSRAKRSALFDFLVVKRTLAIKGENAVAITETEPAFIDALEELGACGEYNGHRVKPDEQYYLNVFAVREKGKRGYRRKRYRSNGTNSTIAGEPWRHVVSLSNDDPRRASLATGYLDHLTDLVLTQGSPEDRPNLNEIAIWYNRLTDVEPLLTGATTVPAKLAALTADFRHRLGLTPEEVERLFATELLDTDMPEAEVFAAALANPEQYLPGESAPAPAVVAQGVGTCPLDLVVALAAKNFVILTGPSGTGKSRSALRLAESIQHAIGDQVAGAIFQLVPVGPDWTSAKRLLGFKTPFGKLRHTDDGEETHESYEITETLRLILRASHPDVAEVPHFLIFDEMNLSHVERYFAPFLSLMEAANVLDEKEGVTLLDEQEFELVAQLLAEEDGDSSEAQAAQVLLAAGKSLTIPSNLFFVGTVNVDETTYMFSPKVLDRAHVIEIESQRPSDYLLDHGAAGGEQVSAHHAIEVLRQAVIDREQQLNELPNPAAILDRLVAAGFTPEELTPVKAATIRALDGCYDLLLPVGFPFGYRISKEVFSYMRACLATGLVRGLPRAEVLSSWPDALDRAVLQKVLPKIHGNKRVLGDSLKATAAFLSGGHRNSAVPARYSFGQNTVIDIAPENALALPVNPQMRHSTKKLEAMHDRLGATGYVSFVS